MSLIDEALKRAQAAHQEEKRQEDGARPWTPAPLPDRRRIARARVRAIGLLLSVAAGLFVVAVLLLRSARNRGSPPTSAASAAVRASSSAAGLPPITREVTVAAPPRGISSSAPNPANPRAADRAAPSAPIETRSSAPPGSPSAPPLRSAATPPAAYAETREPKGRMASEPRSYSSEMPLPGGGKISLEGIVYSETNPVAVLNGRVLSPGGYVEGFTVAKILPDRVELEAEGTKVFLTLR